MSSFPGCIAGIPGISIDRFDNENVKSKIFFLSHVHSDHTVGLNELPAASIIYASSISSLIIQTKYPHLEVKCLEIGFTEEIKLDHENESIRFHVTAISAGHCPGSVMFYFETTSGLKLIYTGDFRIQSQDIEQITYFKEFSKKSDLDVIYLDSTFLRVDYNEFPTQSESVAEIVRLTKEWLDLNEKHKVYFTFPARYGYEALLIELSKHFRQKIKVFDEIYENYKYISLLEDCVTISKTQSRIQVINWRFCNSLAKSKIDLENVRVIKPSALFWRNWKKGGAISAKTKEHKNILRVCYSNHSSYDEIKKLLLFIKPKKISLSVLPKDELEKKKMLDQVLLIQKEYLVDQEFPKDSKHKKVPENIASISFKRIKSFQVDRTIKKARTLSSDSEDEDFFAKCKIMVQKKNIL